MDTFTLDPRCWRIGRIFGRNPLIRRADRIEALVTLVALIVSLVAIPVAGVAALLVYNARGSRYAQETDERHTVAATVLESETDAAGSTVVQARWPVATGERTGPLQLTREAKVGQHIEIWVDTGGDPVAPPTPTWHAVGDAYGTALAILLCMGVTMTSFVTGVRSRLDRACDAQWDREIRCLQDDGGRTNQH